MKIKLIILLILGSCPLFSEDIVLNAMKDEMKRNISKLQFENLNKPYFISYSIYDSTSYFVSASLGSIKQDNFYISRDGKVDIRIGNKDFDSSNFISNFDDYKPLRRNFPIEDDYDAIRKVLWLLSDDGYKAALEKYSQKDAYRKKKDIKEIYGDLTEENPVVHIEKEPEFPQFDFNKYKEWVKKVSNIFRKYKNIQDSDVNLNYSILTKRFVNSEGTFYKTYSSQFSVSVYIQIQNETGYKINDSKDFIYNSFLSSDLTKTEQQIENYARTINDSYKGEKIDYYVGPAIFEDDAAGEFFNQLFVRNISFNPKPWAEKDEWLKYYYDIPKLTERLGKRIFPAFISVYDNPLESLYNGIDLTGSYKIDDEGVKPEKLEIVKKGKLLNIYSSRIPYKDIKKSNAHGRGSLYSFISPSAGNVFINSEKTFTHNELIEKLINMGKEQDLDYVLVIKKIGRTSENEKLIGDPIIAYKLDIKTKKEIPLDVSEFDGIGFRALRDIMATDNMYLVYNFNQKEPFYSGNYIPTSIICPKTILIQEVELKKTEKKTEKKPYLKNPYFN